ncbi:MAG TPA: hypothetical protein VGH79_07495 [Gaiellaceae bacterium]|jgi:hypothetical protein
MTASAPHIPLVLDPLIAEAKRRARRRRFLAFGLVAAAAIVAALNLSLRPGQPGRGSLATSSATKLPADRLIVPDVSIAGIRVGEPRRDVEARFGAGKRLEERDTVSYWGRRLVVSYYRFGARADRVTGLVTRWPGFRTRSGLRIGSTWKAMRNAGFLCDDYCVPSGGKTSANGFSATIFNDSRRQSRTVASIGVG